jgi:hypothetical protein
MGGACSTTAGGMDFREVGIGWAGVQSIDMVQDRDQWRTLVNAVLNLRVP